MSLSLSLPGNGESVLSAGKPHGRWRSNILGIAIHRHRTPISPLIRHYIISIKGDPPELSIGGAYSARVELPSFPQSLPGHAGQIAACQGTASRELIIGIGTAGLSVFPGSAMGSSVSVFSCLRIGLDAQSVLCQHPQ